MILYAALGCLFAHARNPAFARRKLASTAGEFRVDLAQFDIMPRHSGRAIDTGVVLPLPTASPDAPRTSALRLVPYYGPRPRIICQLSESPRG